MTAPPVHHWQTSRFRLELTRPLVMGIVNATPDSFSDGESTDFVRSAIERCGRLAEEGADLLDLGGESTRPGALTPDPEVEWERVKPVLAHALTLGIPVSVDTSEPLVMRRALEMGADVINDVRALRRPGALAVVAAFPSAGVCLMHLRGEPATMQQLAAYGDVVSEVREELAARLRDAVAAGVSLDRIVLDPGIGFAKSAEHNWMLLQRQAELLLLGRPLLVGWSRKGTLGRLTGRPVHERQSASVAAALACVQRGASIVRVHDVAATVDALAVWRAAGLPGGH